MRIILFIFLMLSPFIGSGQMTFQNVRSTSQNWLQAISKHSDDTTELKYKLYRSGLFQQVAIVNDSTVHLKEKKFWIPYFGFNLSKDHEPQFLLGASYRNLFGRGVEWTAFGQYYTDFWFETYLNAPLLFNGNHGPLFIIKAGNRLEPIFLNGEDTVVNYGLKLTSLGYSWALDAFWLLRVRGTVFNEQYHLNRKNGDLLLDLNKLSFGIEAKYEKITYDYHQLDGIGVDFGYEHTFEFPERLYPFHKIFIQSRYYKDWNRWNLAGRLRLGWSDFNSSPFPAFVLDDIVNVRGVGDRVQRGSSELIVNLEWRLTVLQKGNFYGQVVGFSDFGNVLPSDYDSKKNDPWQNYSEWRIGTGLRLGTYFFYNSCLRVDLAFDPRQWEPILLFGYGQYF